MVDCCFSQNYK